MAEYIDKKQAIDRIASCYCIDCEHSNGILCRACGHQDDMDLIDEMPTADVQPVRHGRWEYIRNVKLSGTIKLCECSICHNKIFGGLSYCGNCGARMDGDTNG